MLIFESLEFLGHELDDYLPFFVKGIVFFELGADMSLILLVVSGDLRLTLLEDFNFEATFSGPLLSQVFIELLN